MRNELVVPNRADDRAAPDHQPWIVIGCCALAYVASLYVALPYFSLDELPILIVQYNLG